jgi:hypothetical protein
LLHSPHADESRENGTFRKPLLASAVVTESLSDDDLDQILARCDASTPGPWFVRQLDDTHAMSLMAVSTTPDTGRGERWPDFDSSEVVAATLVQEPRYVDVGDQRWNQNAVFIAAARTDIPRLVAEIRRLRS